MTNNMKGMLVTLGLFLGLSASRLIVYGPQTLKDKFAYNGNTPHLINPWVDYKIEASYANFGNIPYG